MNPVYLSIAILCFGLGQWFNPQPHASSHYLNLPQNDTVSLEQIDIDGCIYLGIYETNRVIKSKAALEAAVRRDASRNRCLKKLSKIDWDQNILVGNCLNSGACYRPTGLRADYKYNNSSDTLFLDISYHENQPLCRALSKYDYWLLLPRPKLGVTVVSRVSTRPYDDKF